MSEMYRQIRAAEGLPAEHPLLIACNFDEVQEVKTILKSGAFDLSITDEGGNSPLHKCATHARGAPELIDLLVAHGFDVNAMNQQGETPLMVAVKFGAIDAVNCLIAASADVNLFDTSCGFAPLHIAAQGFHVDEATQVEVCKALINAGANVNQPNPAEFQLTPLHYASLSLNRKLLQFLVQVPGINLNAVDDRDGRTALLLILNRFYYYGSSDIIDQATVLIEAGIDVNIDDKYDQDAMYVAIRSNFHKVCALLYERGAAEHWDMDDLPEQARALLQHRQKQ